jgi:hypothetical protein
MIVRVSNYPLTVFRILDFHHEVMILTDLNQQRNVAGLLV